MTNLVSIKKEKNQESIYEVQKRSIVNIQTQKRNFLGFGTIGCSSATGFIVDAKEGLVVTNKHVAPHYCESVMLAFSEGKNLRASQVYVDPIHDFTILKYDPSEIDQVVYQVVLGDFFSCQVGDAISTMGNNECESYTFKSGHIISLNRYSHKCHGLMMQTSLDISGGSSGSPVFNEKGEVVAIHSSGKDSTSFEYCINYIVDKLNELKSGKILRGGLGVDLDSHNQWHINDYFGADLAFIKEKYPSSSDLYLTVEALIPNGPSEGILAPGDIILSVEGRTISDNSYLFDRLVDLNTGKSVTITLMRKGKLLSVDIEVEDYAEELEARFVKWAGGTFSEVTSDMRFLYNIPSTRGIFMCRGEAGTSMSGIGINSNSQADRKGVVIYEIAGHEVNSLNELTKIIPQLQGVYKIMLHCQDFLYNYPASIELVNIDEESWFAQEIFYDRSNLKWIYKSIKEK